MIEFNKVPNILDINLNQIEAVIFDMDGTLLNSEVLHAKALLELIGNNGDEQQLLKDFVGVAEPSVYETLLKRNIIPQISFDEFIDLKNKCFKDILKNKDVSSKLLDKDLFQLIKKFKDRGLKVALVTASERGTTDIFMNELNLLEYFDIILTRNDTEKSKPDPMPYQRSFELLDIEPHQALIFEDSKTGLESAMRSEANVCKVSWY